MTIWQAASGAEDHQCWPPILTNSTDIRSIENHSKQTIRAKQKQKDRQARTRQFETKTRTKRTPGQAIQD